MIKFKSIKFKNFLSSGNQFIEINLSKSNATLIVGGNGAGKSTLLDALCFVLFNKPFRLIKKEQMVNTINNGDTLVECEFEVGTNQFKVIRGIKPNVFEIYQNGNLLNQHANNVDYQKTLEQSIMKLNYRSFIQVVLLGSSSYEPFMRLKARYRREVVEEILYIKIFGQMDMILRNKQGELSKQFVDINHQHNLLTEKVELQSKHYDVLTNKSSTVITSKESQLDKNNKHIKDYQTQIDELDIRLNELKEKSLQKKKADIKANKLAKLEAKIETNLLNHKKNLDFFIHNDTCYTCTQPIDNDFKQTKINSEANKVTKLEDGLKELLSEIIKTETQVNQLTGLATKMNEMQIDMAKIKTSLDNLKSQSADIQKELDRYKGDVTDIDKLEQEILEMKVKLSDITKEKTKITEEKKYVDVAREILNDTGAKSKIIQKYLPIMNQLVNQYLQSMNFFINFHLDEEFNETIKSRYRDVFKYESFSEGEKMRIDLALLFTWRMIAKMKNSTNTNLLILDEVFDSSLDFEGTDDFLKILQKLTNENVFIISHKSDIMIEKFPSVLRFEKYKNFTRIVQ